MKGVHLLFFFFQPFLFDVCGPLQLFLLKSRTDCSSAQTVYWWRHGGEVAETYAHSLFKCDRLSHGHQWYL